MEIHTIGFTKRTAEDFFTTLKQVGIKRLIDIRLNNSGQLAGFTKGTDLAYFLAELLGAEYVHEPLLAPTKEILKRYRESGDWADYERAFFALLAERGVEHVLDRKLFENGPVVLLCSERTAEHCHRRLVCEYLDRAWGSVTRVDL